MALVVTVLVDEPALDREFTYLVTDELADKTAKRPGDIAVEIGTIVRVRLQRRSVRGWITRVVTEAEHAAESRRQDYDLAPVVAVVGRGPPAPVVDLAGWAAARWAGTRPHFLRAASPERVVTGLPPVPRFRVPEEEAGGSDSGAPEHAAASAFAAASPLAAASGPIRPSPTASPAAATAGASLDACLSADFADHPPSVVVVGPNDDWWPLVVDACRLGRVLALTPTLRAAWAIADRLQRAQVAVAVAPQEWAQATVAQVVVGARGAAWAPAGSLDAVLVFDEHDQAYQSEAAPTWHARTVAMERARRCGAPCVLVSPAPSPEAIRVGRVVEYRAAGPAGSPAGPAGPDDDTLSWPELEIVDRRGDDPYSGEWCSDRLARVLTDAAGAGGPDAAGPGSPVRRTVVCVLNRKGRARLAICRDCGELARGETTGAALKMDGDLLVDPVSGETRPAACSKCGALRFRRAKLGVKGVAAEMESLTRRRVVQIAGDAQPGPDDTGLYIGTEAVLQRVAHADVVAFLDFDQELLAPRYRADEEAMALLVLAARLVGPRSGGGRILVQTRQPDHPVLTAAAAGTTAAWSAELLERRRGLRQPPCESWALVSGAAAGKYVERLRDFADTAAADGEVWRV
ncbi:MAG TPA: hypothetical protein DEP66_03625, partial [Acidimicrobiaceae bacterium]|nr:hypothetical protein [Acidimicrobiaceae bacterium]